MRDMEKKRARDRARMRRFYGIEPDEGERQPRLLVIDIETMANLVWEWDVRPRAYWLDPKMIVKHKRVISFAAKFVGERKMFFASEETHDHDGMIHLAWELLDEADAVIGYNSKRFDIRHLNAEFVVAGLPRPSGFQHIDLLTVARREFLFGSNKLEAVASKLGIGHKREHEGIALWLKVEAGDKQAWKRMKDYNIQDVKLTEQLFERFREWIPVQRQSTKRVRELLEQ